MMHCCWPRSIRRIATGAGLLLVLVAGLAAEGVAEDTFVVSGVDVDVTAETAAQARDQALAEGERRAFRILLRRLTSESDWGSLPDPTSERIARYIRDFEVASEKSSAVRYIATLNFRFREQPVRQLLAERNTPFAMTRSKPVVVVPVYEDAGTQVLWEDPNPWRDAWAGRSKPEGLVPLVVPSGDGSDAGAVDAASALEGNQSNLSAIARRHGAYTALVAHAVREDAGAGAPSVKVSLVQYGPGGPEHRSETTVTGREGETIDDVMARAADGAALEMEQAWKGRNLVKVTGRSVTAVTMPIASLSQWQAVRQRLERVPVIQHMEVVLLSKDNARLNLFHMGTPDQLAVALRQADLVMTRRSPPPEAGTGAGSAAVPTTEPDEWILSLPSAGVVQGQ
jgi:hypothetical protein